MALTAAFRIPDPPVTSSYGAGRSVRPGNKKKPKNVVTDFYDPNNQPRRTSTRPVSTRTTGGSLTDPIDEATGNPWDDYLAQMDAREAAARDEAIRARAASARNYMSALAGFGGALQGSAADAWQKILGSYNEGAAALTNAQAGIAGQYGAGLTAGQGQLDIDAAALNSGMGAGVDQNAAQQQVATVGGADPGGTLGLVGRAWEGYGETVPGNIGFMTEQNIAQAGREGLAAEDEIRAQFAAEMANNPEAAMAMWQNVQQYDLAKEQQDLARKKQEADITQAEIENQYAAAKNQREENAAALVYQKFLADQGKTAWQIAKDMTNFTGHVWGVDKKGKPYDTNRTAPGSRAGTSAQTAANSAANRGRQKAADLSRSTGRVHVYDESTGQITDTGQKTETATHNEAVEDQAYKRIGLSRQSQALAKRREDRLSKPKDKGGYSDAERRQFGKQAANIAGRMFYGVLNKNFDPSKDPGPKNRKFVTQIGTPEQALREMLSAGIPYSIAWNAIYQYAIQADKKDRPGWVKALSWNPNYDSPARRKKAQETVDRRESTTGR